MSKNHKFLIGPAALDCNRGDQALAWEAIGLLRQVSPNCEIAIMSDFYADPNDCQSRQTRKLGISVIPSLLFNPRRVANSDKNEIFDPGWSSFKMKIQALLDFVQSQFLLIWANNQILARLLLGKHRYESYKYLRSCDALVIKGGGYIYAYRGLRWAYFIWFTLFPLKLAQRCGVKVIILPNSFGPFETKWSRWLARSVLGKCEVITTRELKSLEVINTVIPGKAESFPDMAFSLEPEDSEWAKKELMNHGVPVEEGMCVGLTMRPWRFPNIKNPKEKYSQYIQSFVELIKYLLGNGYTPVLFAHVTGPHSHENDRLAIEEVLNALLGIEGVFYVHGDYDCKQVKSFYGLMDFMVCTRFHSAIFSISQEVPCLAISYQGYKAGGIMSEMGLEHFTLAIEELSSELLIKTFERLISRQQIVKQKMNTYMNVCDERLCNLKEIIESEIGKTAD